MGEMASAALPALGEGIASFFGSGGAEAAAPLFYSSGPEFLSGLGPAASSITVPLAGGAGELGAGLAGAGGGGGGFFEGLSSLFSGAASGVGDLFSGGGGNNFSGFQAPGSGGGTGTNPLGAFGDFFGSLFSGFGGDGGLGSLFATPAAAATLPGGPGSAAPGDNPLASFNDRFNAATPDAAGGMPSNALGLQQAAPAGGSSPGEDPLTKTAAATPSPLTPGGAASPASTGAAPAGGGGDTLDPLLKVQTPQQPTSLMPEGGFKEAAAANSAAGAPSKGQNIWDTISKWAGPAVAAGGLGYNILNRPQGVPSTSDSAGKQNQLASSLSGVFGQQAANANTLTRPLLTGQLPPGYQTAVDQATQSAIAQAKSDAIKMGAPGDPSKNSVLAARIEQIQRNATIQATQLASQLAQSGQSMLQTGVNAAQLEKGIYDSLINVDQKQSDAMSKAIANFAASMSSRPNSINLNLGRAA